MKNYKNFFRQTSSIVAIGLRPNIMLAFLISVHFAAEGKHKQSTEFIDEGLRGRVEHIFSDSDLQKVANQSEVHEYKAEVTRLMNILVDSLYQNKDIFLREIISNANDALDKIRFSALRNHSVLDGGPRELEVLIDVDENNHTLSITDTGIGMTKKDLIEKLGTIAKSGTNDFQRLLQSGDTNLIGQFGVGFYSTFLVSDRVTVISKHNNDDKQWIWLSDAGAHFSVAEDPRGVTLGRGTQIILHLKESCWGYLDRDRLVTIIRHYSMFVDFPVKIWHYHQVTQEETEVDDMDEEERDEADIFEGDADVVESSEDSAEYVTNADGEKEKKGVKKHIWQWEQINTRRPIWLRDPSHVPENDYNEFFKAFFKDNNPPLYHAHFKAEGRLTFSALLFIPGSPQSGDRTMERITRNVRLYVKRVLVQDEWGDELLPDYLHFVKGVIDSSDLTLNVDRDHLARQNTLRLIKRRVTTKLLSTFQHMYQFEQGMYYSFYKNYAGNLKYGVIEDSTNRRALSKLLMFFTSYSPNDLTTLDEYLSRMKKGQDKIYYIGSSTRESAAVSPYLEDLYSRGIEVIFAVEPIDLYCLDRMEEFDGISLENPEREKEKGRRSSQDMSNFNITQRDFSQISRWFKKVIGDRLEKISLSTRLKSTPAIATCTNWGYTASHERLIRAQTVHDQRLTDSIMLNRKILELNPEHPVIIELFNRVKTRPDDVDVVEDALLLYDTALVAGGFTIDGVLNYTKRIFRMLGRAHKLEREIENFEIENAIDYQTIDDEFGVPGKAPPPPKITVVPPPKIPKDVEPIRVPRQSEESSGEDDKNE